MSSKVLPHHSLKTRIILATLIIFVVGLWSLSFYISRMLREDMEHLLGEQQFSTASMLAAQINRELENRLGALKTEAGKATLPLQAGPTALHLFLEQSHALHDLFNGGALVHDIEGTSVADFPASAGRTGVNYQDIDVIAAALKEGKSGIGRPVLGKKLKQPVIGLASPILDAQGTVIGVLSGIINLGLPSFLDDIPQSRYGKTGGHLLVAPQYRLVVTASDKNRIMETLPAAGVIPSLDKFIDGFEGTTVFVNPTGAEVLASVKRIPVAEWYVSSILPTAEAFAPIRDMQRRMLLATLLLTVLATSLSWWVLKSQLSPLLIAANELSSMTDTDLPPHPLSIVRPDEIGQLIGGFNRLLKTLSQREAFLKQILNTSSVAIFLVSTEGRILQANQRMAEMFGVPIDALLGSEYVSLIHPSERETGRQQMRALLASEITSVDLDRLYWRPDQTEFWGHLTGRCLYDGNGANRGLVGVIADIDVRKQAEKSLQLAASVFTHAREGITITSADGTIIEVNDAFTRITGYSREEALGHNPRVLKSDHHEPQFYAALWGELIEKGHWHGEIWNRRKTGELYAEIITISAVCDEHGKTRHYVALFTDITPMKEHEKQLEHMAHYDVLTALPNRVLLADRLLQAMVQVDRRKRRVAVVYLDLDGFKAVNDSHGHKTGDQLLIALASRMKQSLREGDTLARLGGDEFVAVLLDLDDVSASVPMLMRLLAAAAQPVIIGNLALQVSASLGVTFYPQPDEVDADQLLRQADQAMYQAKVAGKNRYHIFDAAQDRSVRGHHESIQRIRSGLAAREFVLYYQPKVNMRTGAIIGAEALIRWQHPEKGLLPPATFLPMIENHSLSLDIGEWVIEEVLTQMERWRSTGLDIPVSANVNAHQLQQPDFARHLREILARHSGVRAGDLELEVLETSALEDLIGVSQVIKDCRNFGVRFALDDFGTGYSSLTYLKRLPVSQLKIDQSFVRDMLDDPDDLAILEGVISLAAAFRREVIAEGVETIEHGEMLLQLGCEQAQGYGIARPMPAADFPAWVDAWQPVPAWQNLSPIDRDDLPLLFASVEHRAWIVALEDHLKDSHTARPPLDLHSCRFGLWMDTEGLARYSTRPVFQAIDHLHQQVHGLAEELCELQTLGRNHEALARLEELHGLRDTLLKQLQILTHESRP